MQDQKVIELLGYSAKEAKVYLAMLSLGECHVSDIASKVNIPRTSVQIILDKLYKDGLVNFYVMKRYKYWVAENPERILANLAKKQTIVQENLPKLVTLRKVNKGRRYKKSKSSSLPLLRMLADVSIQPVLITNENHQILYVNMPWENQLGYLLEEVRGENPRMLQTDKTPPEIYEQLFESLTHEKLFQTDKIVDRRKNGTFIQLLTTFFPIKHNGEIFYIQILTDNTSAKNK